MSATPESLNASLTTLKSSIISGLKMDVPSDVKANIIAPILGVVNQWSTQIPVVLADSLSPTSNVNLIFSIRKELFAAPQFTQSVLGIPVAELPAVFQEFLSFISKLIEVQKIGAVPKVSLACPLFVSLVP